MSFQPSSIRFKEFANDGTPLAGGRLYTYSSGTTTHKAVYTDATLGTPATYTTDGFGNKYVSLDARGEARAWLGSGAYTYYVTDEDGANGRTTDGIEDKAGSLVSDLSNTTDANKGVSLVGIFLGGLAGYVGRALSLWFRDRPFNPCDWGADKSGVIDASDAIEDMFAAINAARYTGAVGSSVTAGTMSLIDFGSGKFKVSRNLPVPPYCKITGSRAQIIPTTNTFDIFTVGYMTDIEGLVFMAGRRAIKVETGNVDSTVINVRNNEFHEQTLSAVETDGNSASTRLNIDECKVYNTNPGATVYKFVTGDLCTIRGGWATVAGTFVQSGDLTHQCETVVDGVCGVPMGGSTVWGVNYSSLTFTPGTRFGGEAGATLVKNYAGIDASVPNVLAVTECQAYCAGKYAVEFYAVPNLFLWRNNRGQVNSLGFKFDAGITNLSSIRSYLAGWIIEGNVREESSFQGFVGAMARCTVLQADTTCSGGSLLVSDKVAQARANTATGGASANTTITNQTGIHGQPTRRYVGANSAYDGTVSETWSNQLTGFGTAIYTAVYEVTVQTSHPVAVTFFGGDLDTVTVLRQGRHIVNVPFYWDLVSSQNRVGWSIAALNNAQQIEFGSIRVFNGDVQVATVNNVLHADAAPTTLQWEVGDRTERQTPTVGSAKRWLCTAAGVPGTWVSEGNL
jgi:hypothetical protein